MTQADFAIPRDVAGVDMRLDAGGLREMHRHPNADEWRYHVTGRARMTVFNAGPRAETADFGPGDVRHVGKSLGHHVENTGTDDLVFLGVFKTSRREEISLTDWLVHTPAGMVARTPGIDPALIGSIRAAPRRRWRRSGRASPPGPVGRF